MFNPTIYDCFSLQTEINKIMPGLLENYEKESQRIIQKKYSIIVACVPMYYLCFFRFSKESVDNEENKCLRMPKRRFQWNDITKFV